MKVYGLSCLRHLQRLIYFLISIVSVFRSLNDLVGHKDSLGLLNAVQRIRQQTDAGMANRILVLAHMGCLLYTSCAEREKAAARKAPTVTINRKVLTFSAVYIRMRSCVSQGYSISISS